MRALVAAVPVLIAVLVLTAAPAQAAHTVAYDSHTTDSEFNSATTLQNVTVEGSGASANVTLAALDNTVDSFEDGGLSEYSGSTGDWTTSTTYTTDGTIKLESSSSSPSRIVSTPGGGLPRYYDADSGNLSVDLNLQGTNRIDVLFSVADIDNAYIVRVTPGGLDIQEWEFGSRFSVAATGNLDASVPTTDYVSLEIDDDGSLAKVTLYNEATGAYIADATFNKDDNGDGIGFDANASGVYIDNVHISTLPDRSSKGTYISQNYTLDRAADAWANLTLENASADVTWQGTNGNTWTDVASATYTSTGNNTQSLSGNYDTWRANVTFIREPGNTTARLHDEGIRFASQTPVVDNSSATPNGTTTLTDPITLEIDVTDGDFATSQDDTVDVEFFHKSPTDSSFSSVGTDTLTSNGTASVTFAAPQGGTHEWYVWANDSYTNTQQSNTANFSRPASIAIRNESNASQYIKSPVEVHAVIFAEDRVTVVEETVTSGNLSVQGLPVTGAVVIRLDAPGFYARSYYVEDLGDEESAYLLNSTAYPDAKVIEFRLDDRTGRFSEDANTTIRIQRAVDRNNDGNLTWDTVAGDYFDASSGFFFTGQTDIRYRVIVENSDGERRNLGPYTVISSETEVLTIGRVSWPAINGSSTFFTANLSYDPQGMATPPVITIQYRDPGQNTTDLNVTVYNRDTGSILYSDQPSGTFGSYVSEVNLTDSQAENETWVVELRYEYNGESVTQTRLVGSRGLDLPIDPQWLGAFAFVLIPLVIALYGPRTWHYGLGFALGIVGLLMLFQLVTIPVAGYAVGMVIAVAGLLKREGIR